jgi:hypothetical protein
MVPSSQVEQIYGLFPSRTEVSSYPENLSCILFKYKIKLNWWYTEIFRSHLVVHQ